MITFFFFFSSRRRHTRWNCDWSSDVCSSDLRRGSRAGLLKSSSSTKPPLLPLDEASDRGAEQRPADGGVVGVQAAADRNESLPSARSPEQLLAHRVGNHLVGGSMDVEHGKLQLAHLLDG